MPEWLSETDCAAEAAPSGTGGCGMSCVEEQPGLFRIKLIDGESGARNISLLRGWLEPGACHAPHTHDIEEAVLFLRGRGYVTVNDCRRAVGPGDALLFPPGSVHSTENPVDGESLHFVAAFPDSLVSGRQVPGEARRWRRSVILWKLGNRIRWALRKLLRLSERS